VTQIDYRTKLDIALTEFIMKDNFEFIWLYNLKLYNNNFEEIYLYGFKAN